MKIYAPSYYKDFSCIASKCKHSCCELWQIEIDDATYEKYQKEGGDFAKQLKKNIKVKGVLTFKQDRKRRCSFLRKDGLCSIICQKGTDFLCNVCDKHPRFYFVGADRCEIGLGLCCEEACRLALESKTPFTIEQIGSDEREELTPTQDELEVIKMRDRALDIVTQSDNLNATLLTLEQQFNVTEKAQDVTYFLSVLKGLERLDKGYDKKIKSAIKRYNGCNFANENQLKNFLSYLVYRHCTTAENSYDFSLRMGLCVLSVRLVSALNDGGNDYLETVREYCAEVEYSEDNLSIMLAEIAF